MENILPFNLFYITESQNEILYKKIELPDNVYESTSVQDKILEKRAFKGLSQKDIDRVRKFTKKYKFFHNKDKHICEEEDSVYYERKIITIKYIEMSISYNSIRIYQNYDDYYFVWFCGVRAFYQCDEMEGLLQFLENILFKNYKKITETEELRYKIGKLIKTMDGEDLLKIKNLFIENKGSSSYNDFKNIFKDEMNDTTVVKAIVKQDQRQPRYLPEVFEAKKIQKQKEILWEELPPGTNIDEKINNKFQPFSSKEFIEVKNFIKGYKINIKGETVFLNRKLIHVDNKKGNTDYHVCNGVHCFDHDNRDFIKNAMIDIRASVKDIEIFKDNDSYFYVCEDIKVHYNRSRKYKCDEMEGLLQCLENIFKNYRKQDFDTEQIRTELSNKLKTLSKEDLLKIKNILG